MQKRRTHKTRSYRVRHLLTVAVTAVALTAGVANARSKPARTDNDSKKGGKRVFGLKPHHTFGIKPYHPKKK